MKCFMISLLLAMVMALAMTVSASSAEPNLKPSPHDDEEPEVVEPSDVMDEPASLRGGSRFLAERSRRVTMTCNNYPRICRARGSPGPDCCKKRCVDVSTDRQNCGKCGRNCRYSEICCKGKCVNPFSDKKHCGGCNSKCKKHSTCVYGMCSYA